VPAYEYVIVVAGTVLWCIPFVLAHSRYKGALTLDRRARWGLALEGIGYTLIWQGSFWTRSPTLWQTALSLLLFATACALSWTGAFALGRQLRVDAALADNHELIRSGPYRFVRHPLYTSMLCVLVATGVVIASWYLLLAGMVLFLIGTEIRMRLEDALLEARFGDEFRNYRRTVPGFIPLVR
jgi:protein-S-isoprenylcysteine O-methyltransferase Ste14